MTVGETVELTKNEVEIEAVTTKTEGVDVRVARKNVGVPE